MCGARIAHRDIALMNERALITALTQIAMLNAIILSFLGIQFIIPFAFILLLWIVPTIFALEIILGDVPWQLAFLSGLVLLALAFTLFGLDVGLWTIVYLLVGSLSGWGQRFGLHWSIRLLSTTLAFALLLVAMIAVLGWLVQIEWQEIKEILENLNQFNPLPTLALIPAMGIGLVTWAIMLSVGVEWFLSRVLRHLRVSGRGTD